MEGYQGIPPGPLTPRFWAPGWNSAQALTKFQSEINGPLLGGDPGKRLIEPDESREAVYFDDIPEAFIRRPGEWLVAPAFHIFGSEKLSAFGTAVSERVPKPYVGLNEGDANSLGKKEGDEVTLDLGNEMRSLPVRIIPSLPSGLIALPVGLPGLKGMVAPKWGKVSDSSSTERKAAVSFVPESPNNGKSNG